MRVLATPIMIIIPPIIIDRVSFSSRSTIPATTERLMKKACDALGIKRKTNARPTLHTFIHEYQTKKPLDDKSLTQLNVIKEFRNRATHHFNIDWDESFIVLSQFCQFVEWYAETHALTE